MNAPLPMMYCWECGHMEAALPDTPQFRCPRCGSYDWSREYHCTVNEPHSASECNGHHQDWSDT